MEMFMQDVRKLSVCVYVCITEWWQGKREGEAKRS